MQLTCGIDESGRGPLAGPVTAVACASFTHNSNLPDGLADSKQLSKENRNKFASILRNSLNVFFAYGWVSPHTIDRINIHQATLLAMQIAYKNLLRQVPIQFAIEEVLVDGLHFPDIQAQGKAIVKGDCSVPYIQAASILAKTARDALMAKYAKQFPVYSFNLHNGYPTRKHIEQIMQHGMSPIHRKTFCKKYIN